MKWRRSDLTYCTNVHPAEDVTAVKAVIQGPLSNIRQIRRLDRMGSGLWLSREVADELCRSEKSLQTFADHLKAHDIELFTLNGFPYGDFHAERVKQQVYQPDWTDDRRLSYTLDLAGILAHVLPGSIAEGTISSVPLGFTPGWNDPHHQTALEKLSRCMHGLDEIRRSSGRSIRLCLEMEPGCVLERTPQLIHLFAAELPTTMRQIGLHPDLLQRHLGTCFDVCHQAVMFEDCYASLQAIHQADIPIGKIQISSALQLSDPSNPTGRGELARFNEARYLHQSCYRDDEDRIHRALDLDQALQTFPETKPWRCHFHIPIQSRLLASKRLNTTQGQILRTLDFLSDYPEVHPHLEVETYTWQVLPEAIRPSNETELVEGLTAELTWLEQAMSARGLLQDDAR